MGEKYVWNISCAGTEVYEKVKNDLKEDFRRLSISEPKVIFDDESLLIRLGYSKIEIMNMGLQQEFYKVKYDSTIFDGMDRSPIASGRISPKGVSARRPMEHWQERRKILADVQDFYEMDGIEKTRPPISDILSSKTPLGALKLLLEKNEGVCIGEVHSSIASKRFLIENMCLLKAEGVDTIYLEHILSDLHQNDINIYLSSESEQMPTSLAAYLRGLDNGHMGMVENENKQKYNFTELVKAAKSNRVKVVAVDTEVSYNMFSNDANIINPEMEVLRYKTMNYLAAKKINCAFNKTNDNNGEANGKWIVFAGSGHVTKCKDVLGLSEILGVPSIVIDDIEKGRAPSVNTNNKGYADGQITPDIVITIDPNEPCKEEQPKDIKKIKKIDREMGF